MLTAEDITKLEKIAANHVDEKRSILAILQDIQKAFGYLPEDAINWIAERLWIPKSKFWGVATFYTQFYLHPRGKNVIEVCCGSACIVKGSERLIASMKKEFNLANEQDTTEDLGFTIEPVSCVGACSIAPVVIINKKVHGKATTDKLLREIKNLQKTIKKGSEQ